MTQAEFELPEHAPPQLERLEQRHRHPHERPRIRAGQQPPRVARARAPFRAKKAGRGGLWLGAALGAFVGAFGLWQYRSGSLVANAENSGRPVSAAPPPAPPPVLPSQSPCLDASQRRRPLRVLA